MLHERTKAAPLYLVILVFVILAGLIIGAAFVDPPVGKHDRTVEQPISFDPPLKKGVDGLVPTIPITDYPLTK